MELTVLPLRPRAKKEGKEPDELLLRRGHSGNWDGWDLPMLDNLGTPRSGDRHAETLETPSPYMGR